MEIDELVKYGILFEDGEHINEQTVATVRVGKKSYFNVVSIITNKKLIFLQKRRAGFFSEGYNVIMQGSLDSILSVTTGGAISKYLVITVRQLSGVSRFLIGCKNYEEFAKILIDSKKNYEPNPTKVSIDTIKTETKEEDKSKIDEPLDVLKLRYAKGEITKKQYEQMKKDLND